MVRLRRRVRLHLVGDDLPSIEGVLVRRFPEFVVRVPQLHVAPNAQPLTPEGREVAVPRDRVAFYERL